MSLLDKKCGLTLAELLITIGLIGSIGALTIPTLAFNYRGKVLEQQFRATYSEIREIGSRLNFERGDVGELAYSCVYGGSKIKCGAQNAAGNNLYSGTLRWASEVMSYVSGGGPYDKDANSTTGISNRLKEIYKNGGAPQGPMRFDRNAFAGIVCDNGGIWTDAKGRLWTFNGENQFVCVDINGTAPPNKLNVDTFIFKPMSAKEMAIYIYDDPDPEHYQNYNGQFVPCDIQKVSDDNWGNLMPQQKGFSKGSGSAVDWCYFNEPVENVAAMKFKNRLGEKENYGTSARGKRVTPKNDYWRDYINYR